MDPLFRIVLVPALLVLGQQPQGGADRVLRTARERLGGDAMVRAVWLIETVADCQGPRGAYETRVTSTRTGRAIFEQRFPDGRHERTVLSPTSGTAASEWTVAQGHEIHMLVVAPEAVFGAPTSVGDTVFDGHDAVLVTFRDTLGARVRAFFARADSLPLGFAFSNGVTLVLDDWRPAGHVRLPWHAVYHQGADEYRFRFTTISLRNQEQGMASCGALCADGAREQPDAAGGQTQFPNELADSWEWDGAAWHRRSR
jgi:hypothetical protein